MHLISVLFICPYPFNEAPSQRFRFEQYFKILEQNNIAYHQVSFLSKIGWDTIYKDGKSLLKAYHLGLGVLKRIWLLTSLKKYNYIFIHREAAPMGPPIFEWVISKILKKKIIYDFDDAIWMDDPDEKGSMLAQLKWKKKVGQICNWSHKVSVGNEFLFNYAKQNNDDVYLIPSVVDTLNLHNPDLFFKSNPKVIAIGWTGTHSTLQYLDLMVPALQNIEIKNKIQILIIANKNPNLPLKSLIFKPWKKDNEIEDLMKIDIGIMPLSNDVWSQGKGGFKIIQYMSLGIPTLGSPVGINVKLIKNGQNGFLCDSIEEWESMLQFLIDNPLERKKLGRNGRKFIINNYSVSATKDNFLALFQ
jgi:glycosyltransferase involved in cell wall biosynthesis